MATEGRLPSDLNPGEAPIPQDPVARSREDVDSSLVRGLAWTTFGKWLGQLFTWASTIIVARLLTPDDFGLVAMAQVLFGLVVLVAEGGIGGAVVRFRNLTDDQLGRLHTLAVILGWGAFVFTAAAAAPLGWFYDAPELPPVVVVMGSTFVFSAFRVVPYGVLARDMRFKQLAIVESVQALVASVSTLLLAAGGAGYWSLVLGNVVGTMIYTILVARAVPVSFRRPRLGGLSEPLSYSLDLIGSRIFWFVYSNADMVIVGKVLGKAVLGHYSYAWTLALMPSVKITSLIVRVTSGVFSTVQNDRPEMKRYVLRTTEALAIVTFPVAIGLCLVADDLVLAVLGEKWMGAVVPLRVLSAYSALRSIDALIPQLLQFVGESRFVMRRGALLAVAMPVGFYVGTAWGTFGVAMAWAIVYPLLTMPLFVRGFAAVNLSLGEYLRCLWPASSSSVLMTAAVLSVRMALPELDAWPRLLLTVGVGTASYLVAMLTLHRARLTSAIAALRLARSRR